MAMTTALFHGFISLLVLLLAFFLFNGYLHWTCIFIPVVIFPLMILTIGLAWFFLSLGVFLKDVKQTITIATTVLMFLSPVFYPVTAVPNEFHIFIMASQMTFIIEQARAVLLLGYPPNWTGLAFYTIFAASIYWSGYAWFQKTRKGFSDVL
jgi:lipopolysaccharide transport system permease protein